MFTKIVNIRHLGVHRCSLDLLSILQRLRAAEHFAMLHHDVQTYAQISYITASLQEIYDKLSTQQNDLEMPLAI